MRMIGSVMLEGNLSVVKLVLYYIIILYIVGALYNIHTAINIPSIQGVKISGKIPK